MVIPAKKRVVLGLSGGLYSSVAAVLLQEQGYDVFGVHLKFPDDSGCQCSEITAENRRAHEEKIEKFATSLGIPFLSIDVRSEFEAKVTDPARKAFLINRKQNPCVVCHSEIIIGSLYERAKKLGGAWVSTGHRAQIRHDSDRGLYQLLQGIESENDHSFFLYQIPQSILAKTHFPLGTFTNEQILKLADAFQVSSDDKEFSSNELCFDKVFRDPERMKQAVAPEFLISKVFLQNETGVEKIDHQDMKFQFQYGDKIEKKDTDQLVETYYVKRFKLRPHLVIYGSESDLKRKEILLEDMFWVEDLPSLMKSVSVDCRVQDIQERTKGRLFFYYGNRARLYFEEAVLGFYPGKTVVFYNEKLCLGGGRVLAPEVDLPALAR